MMVSDFAKPLPDNEIRHIARSNARYVATHYDEAKYSASQAKKGRRGRESLTARLQVANADRNRAIYDAYHVQRLRQVDIARQFWADPASDFARSKNTSRALAVNVADWVKSRTNIPNG